MSLPDWSQANADAAGPVIDYYAGLYGLPRAVMYGLVSQESRFTPTAIRQEPAINDASYGLTQILYKTAQGLGYAGTPAGLFDPTTNVSLGFQFFSGLVSRFGDVNIALSAYNGGYRNNTITNPSYVSGVMSRAAYFDALWNTADTSDFNANDYTIADDGGTDSTTDTSNLGNAGSAGLGTLLAFAGAAFLLWRRYVAA